MNDIEEYEEFAPLDRGLATRQSLPNKPGGPVGRNNDGLRGKSVGRNGVVNNTQVVEEKSVKVGHYLDLNQNPNAYTSLSF